MRPRSVASAARLVFLLVIVASGCGEQVVVVVRADLGFDGGGPPDASKRQDGSQERQDSALGRDAGQDSPTSDVGGNDAGQACAGNQDCLSQTEFCNKASCGASEGRCQAYPDVCDDVLDAFCGCDGVTYWNDCLRQRDGVEASTRGQCSNHFATCGDVEACPVPDGSCGKLAAGPPGTCDVPIGVCWVLPDKCPLDAGGLEWTSCGGLHPSCTDLCDAILSEQPHERLGLRTGRGCL
jgi:hypothetical protein